MPKQQNSMKKFIYLFFLFYSYLLSAQAGLFLIMTKY